MTAVDLTGVDSKKMPSPTPLATGMYVGVDGDGSPPHIEFHTRRITSTMVLVGVRGEIDSFSAARFRDYIGSQCALDSGLILDLSEVEFIGTAGLGILSNLDAWARRNGRSWAMVGGRSMRRLLRAAGQESVFPCHPSLDSALGSWHGVSA